MMIVAFIPARAGSQRLPGKNLRPLAGHPVMAYSIAAAQESGIFHDVYVVTRDAETATVAKRYGAHVLGRSADSATGEAADILWVTEALARLAPVVHPDAFAIVRATSPFRSAAAIRAGWALLQSSGADSVRAMAPWDGCHPGKLWLHEGDRVVPALEGSVRGVPYHSAPSQVLPPVLRQTAGLELAWVARTVHRGSIAGRTIAPLLVEGADALDLNTPADWRDAEQWLAEGHTLPTVLCA